MATALAAVGVREARFQPLRWGMAGGPTPTDSASASVLASRNEERLTVDPLQPTQAEATQAMPVLGFGKERFDPHLSFAHRLGVGLGRVVGARPVQGGLVEVTSHATPARRGACGPQAVHAAAGAA